MEEMLVPALDSLIVVKQLPIIEERLRTVKESVDARIADALCLACTEDTLKAVKSMRAQLNKEFKEFEERRKTVKNAVMKPLESFDDAYKDCVSNAYKSADAELKKRIESVELGLKEEKTEAVKEYFSEYSASNGIDFVMFEQTGIKVTLTASLKSLKAQAKEFIDKIIDDIALIATQEHSDEIFYYYKNPCGMTFLNAGKAITLTAEKYKAIAAEKAREEERRQREEAVAASVAKVDAAVEELAPPTVSEPEIEEPAEQTEKEFVKEPLFSVRFTVTETREKIKALKEFLNKGAYNYE